MIKKFLSGVVALFMGAAMLSAPLQADDVTEAATRAAQAVANATTQLEISNLTNLSTPSDTYEFVAENSSSPGTLEAITFSAYADYVLEENRPWDLVAETSIADTDVFVIDDGTGTAPKKITALDMDTRFGGGSGIDRPTNLTDDTEVVDSDELVLDDGTGAAPKSITAELLADYMEAEINIGASSALVNNDITAAPYNATCNGIADDSNAFEDAVDDGGVFFLPPGSDCVLGSTSNYAWNTVTIFYGLHGAAEDTQIDLDSTAGTMFDLNGGASVGLYNIKFYNGDDSNFINANGLNGTVAKVICAWTIWEDTNTVCVRWSEDSDAGDDGRIDQYWFLYNQVDNTGTASAENLFIHGGELRDVQVVGNKIVGGKRGIRMGFIEDDDPTARMLDRQRMVFANNTVYDIDGQSAGGGVTVNCIKAMGKYIVIDGNVCQDVHDTGSPADTECIYTKAQFNVISNNVLTDCGDDEAVIASKGSTSNITSCTQGACAVETLIVGNVIEQTDETNDDIRCIHVQSNNAHIIGNSITGCSLGGINVVASGPYRNTKISENRFYRSLGRSGGGDEGAVIRIQVNSNQYNCVINDNVVAEYLGADDDAWNFIRFEIGSGETVDRCVIKGNILPYTDQGDALTGIKIENAGTFNDLHVLDNVFGDMDIGIEITLSGTMNDPTYMGNTFHNTTDSYTENGGQTVNGCFENYNRGWDVGGAPTSDSC